MTTNNAANIIVGAAAFAIGVGTPTVNNVDTTWTQVYNVGGPGGTTLRTWVGNLPSAASGGVTAGTDINGVKFRNAGLTQEGVQLDYTPDYGEVEVDQLLDAAKLFKQKMSVTVKTTLVEAYLENLLVDWDQASNTLAAYGTGRMLHMTPGALGDTPNERHLLFVGNSVSGYSARAYIASRAVSMEASTHSLRRNEATVFPVSFRLLPDISSSFSSYGKVVDLV